MTGSASEKVIFENKAVQIAEARWTRGGTLKMHSHPSFLVIAMVPLEYKSITPDGKTRAWRIRKGESHRHKAGTHAFEGVSTKGRALIVVVK